MAPETPDSDARPHANDDAASEAAEDNDDDAPWYVQMQTRPQPAAPAWPTHTRTPLEKAHARRKLDAGEVRAMSSLGAILGGIGGGIAGYRIDPTPVMPTIAATALGVAIGGVLAANIYRYVQSRLNDEECALTIWQTIAGACWAACVGAWYSAMSFGIVLGAGFGVLALLYSLAFPPFIGTDTMGRVISAGVAFIGGAVGGLSMGAALGAYIGATSEPLATDSIRGDVASAAEYAANSLR